MDGVDEEDFPAKTCRPPRFARERASLVYRVDKAGSLPERATSSRRRRTRSPRARERMGRRTGSPVRAPGGLPSATPRPRPLRRLGTSRRARARAPRRARLDHESGGPRAHHRRSQPATPRRRRVRRARRSGSLLHAARVAEAAFKDEAGTYSGIAVERMLIWLGQRFTPPAAPGVVR
jgi:hypothetical protein